MDSNNVKKYSSVLYVTLNLHVIWQNELLKIITGPWRDDAYSILIVIFSWQTGLSILSFFSKSELPSVENRAVFESGNFEKKYLI